MADENSAHDESRSIGDACGGSVNPSKDDSISSKLQCPSCGEVKLLSKSIGQKGIAVAISANRDFCAHFESAGVKLQKNGPSFKVCTKCCKLVTAAIVMALFLFPSCFLFNNATSSSKAAVTLPNRIVCGGTSLVNL
jgi:predicted RNA-binding Zn-ribbon protein involved in translation (DUF1610 family)